jgi:hypothetical protein
MGLCDFPGGNVAQRNDEGVSDDVLIRFGDGLLRAFVVVVLFVGYLGWLGRSPIAALVFGCVVAVVVRAWHRVPWAIVDRRETAETGGPRAMQTGDLDYLTCGEFQQLIARLMRRDSFVGVRATGARDNLFTDVVGHTPSGQRVVVYCYRDAAHRRVDADAVRHFLGPVDDQHSPDIAVLVTTGRFTRSAIAFSERRDVVLLDRSQVAAWMTGRATPLTPYLAATA